MSEMLGLSHFSELAIQGSKSCAAPWRITVDIRVEGPTPHRCFPSERVSAYHILNLRSGHGWYKHGYKRRPSAM